LLRFGASSTQAGRRGGGIKSKRLSGDQEPQQGDKQTQEKNYLAIQQSLPVASLDDNQQVFEAPFFTLAVRISRHVASFPSNRKTEKWRCARETTLPHFICQPPVDTRKTITTKQQPRLQK
jgi:hypothetical protein